MRPASLVRTTPLLPASLPASFLVPALLVLSVPHALAADAGPEWKRARPGRAFSFPRDHGAHEDHRLEWWYYTGNLETEDGRRLGYQLTFFRTGVVHSPTNPSRWAVRDVYVAHFAVSDLAGGSFRSFERIHRRGIERAGIRLDPEDGGVRVWNDDWSARITGRRHELRAATREASIELTLESMKPPVLQGEAGYSRKGGSEGNASCYYSLTRLRTTGRVRIGAETLRVRGESWMDHEFGTSFLEEEQVGWDWFSIQLEDGRDLMLFQLRREDGSVDPRSSGTIVSPEGVASPIRPGRFRLEPGRTWISPASGGRYPVRWSIHLPDASWRLDVTAALDDQELRTPRSTGLSYWEGAIRVRGTDEEGRQVQGRGYLEMTGYAGTPMGDVMR